MFSCKKYIFSLNALFSEHLRPLTKQFLCFIQWKVVFVLKKYSWRKTIKTWRRRAEFSTIKLILLKPLYSRVIKRGRDWFQQSISDRTFKNLYRWKSTSTIDGGENSSKRGQKQMGERSIDKRIIAKEKSSKKFFLIAYFHLRFCIYAITYLSMTQIDKRKEKGKRTKGKLKLYIWNKKTWF